MTLIRRLCASLLLVAIATTGGWSQDKAEKNAKKGPAKLPQVAQLEKQLDGLGLSAEQNTKVKALLEEHGKKIAAAQQKATEVLTPEQRKARNEAAQKAKGEGKKGKELSDATAAAVKLSPEQQKSFDEASLALKDAVTAMRKAVLESLTPEQRTKLEGATKKKKT